MTSCILLSDCVQQYVSPYKATATGYLVVEGYITGNGPTQYSLTRSIALPGDSAIPVVTGAQLQVEGNDNSIYPLFEQGNGYYGIDSLPLSTAVRYRLRVSTPNGESYLSDFVPYKPTPPIDSVNWTFNPSAGVNIYVNTHDPTNSTRYYQWTFDQTYEYHSAEASEYYYVPSTGSIVQRTPAQQVFTCWMDVPLTNIDIGTSDKLAEDEIYEFPLVNIAPNSMPLSILYSILVKQYSLTDSGYNFLSLMQKNTESLGSIFDAQPSQITGNIHCLTNPNEPVVGYISAGTLQQQRIFINNDQLKNWVWLNECSAADIIVPNNPDSFKFYFGGGSYLPLYQNFGPKPPVFGWYANAVGCTDCTDYGGTTQKPAFWPN